MVSRWIVVEDCRFYDFIHQNIVMKKGEEVKVMDEVDEYYIIRYNGFTGIVEKDKIKLE